MPGFQVGEVFTESLRFVLKQLRALFILAAVPYGLFLALYLLASTLVPADTGSLQINLPDLQSYRFDGFVVTDPATGEYRNLAPELTVAVLTAVLDLLVLLPFKVAWLRYTLLGPRQQRVAPLFSYGSRELRYLGYNIGLLLMVLGVVGAGSVIASMVASTAGPTPALVITIATVVLLAWVTARLYFVFPTLAMDLPGGFARAWTESRGQAFKLILLTVMVLLVLALPAMVVGAIVAGMPLLAVAVGVVLQIVVDGGLWTALAFAYWKTTGIPGPQAPVPGPAAN